MLRIVCEKVFHTPPCPCPWVCWLPSSICGHQNSCVCMRWEVSSLSRKGWVTLESLFATPSWNTACWVPITPQGGYMYVPTFSTLKVSSRKMEPSQEVLEEPVLFLEREEGRAGQIVPRISKEGFLLLSILINLSEELYRERSINSPFPFAQSQKMNRLHSRNNSRLPCWIWSLCCPSLALWYC